MASNSSILLGTSHLATEMDNHGHGFGRGTVQGHSMFQHRHQQHHEHSTPLSYMGGVGSGMLQDTTTLSGRFDTALNLNQPDSPSSTPASSYYGGKQCRKVKDTVLKTPVSLLNEVCAKANMSPVVDLQEDGPAHAKIFTCSVTVEKQGCKWVGKGESNNKKDAKQEAAKRVLLSMDNNVETLLTPPKASSSASVESDQAIETDPDPEGNPVGELNDMTLKLKRLPPEYQDIGEEGKPHERIYTVACKLGTQIVEHGTGRSKKHAKKAAAFKVKQKLLELVQQEGTTEPVTPQENNGVDDPDNIESLVAQMKNSALKTGKKKTRTNKTSSNMGNEMWNLSEWLVAFKERSGVKLQSLQDLNPSISDPVKLLRDVAEEQTFKVEYVDVEKPELEELFSCIVSIGIEPVAIFLGKGGSKTHARKNAAKSALDFLAIAIKS